MGLLKIVWALPSTFLEQYFSEVELGQDSHFEKAPQGILVHISG